MSNEEKLEQELEESWNKGFESAVKTLAVTLMHYLDNQRPEEKMCLSNAECAQIEKAICNRDWETIVKYIKKYS